jgi:DnaD/phage-associated family protein
MSNRRAVFVVSGVDDMTQVTPNAMRVLMHLARRADSEGECFPSMQSIGDHCFSCIIGKKETRRMMARRAVDELVAAGLVTRTGRAKGDGSQTSNLYRVASEKDFIAAGLSHAVVAPEPEVAPVAPLAMANGFHERGAVAKGVDKPAASAFLAYENEIGTLSVHAGELVGKDVDEFGSEWVVDAIREAARANKRNYRYVQGILKRWAVEGHGEKVAVQAVVPAARKVVTIDAVTGERKELLL